MKQVLNFALVIVLFASCKKISREEIRISNEPTGSNISANIQPVSAYRWVQMAVPPFTNAHIYDDASDNIVFSLEGDIYCVTGKYSTSQWYKFNASTKQWQYQPSVNYSFASSHHPSFHQFIFSYQNKVYTGLANSGESNYNNDFKSFDPVTYTIVQLAPFPGNDCRDFTSFVIGNKGYILGGINPSMGVINQLWEYDFTTNQWANKGGSPVGARADATAIVLDGKAYIGLGYDIVTFNNQDVKLYKNDWVLYNPSSPYSAIKAHFAGAKRSKAKGFVIDGNIYLGFGLNAASGFNDFWKYNPSSNTWVQQAGYTGNSTVNNWNTSAFSIGSTGYVVKGNLTELYKFTNSQF